MLIKSRPPARWRARLCCQRLSSIAAPRAATARERVLAFFSSLSRLTRRLSVAKKPTKSRPQAKSLPHFLLAVISAAGLAWAGDLRIVDAVKNRDLKAVQALIAAKIDVNAAQPDGATALSWAAYLDQTETADILIKAGAKVNVSDEYGDTPLTLASSNGNGAIVRELLDRGADANAARWNGETALMLAANSGSVEAVRSLIEHGANVNAVEKSKGQTALMWAAAEGHADVVKLLIDRGADVKALSTSGWSAIVFAAVKNDQASVNALIAAGGDPNFTLRDGNHAVMVATAFRSSKAAAALLEAGANPNVADTNGNTPLHLAAQSGDPDLIKVLLAKGANPNAVSNKAAGGGNPFRMVVGQATPLMLAAKAGHEEAMRLLVAGGADPKIKAQGGTTLLMQAAGSAKVNVVKYAYELAPDVAAVTDSGNQVMHAAVTGTGAIATQEEICDVIRFLLSKGADPDPMNKQKRTPIAIADILPIDKAVDLLTETIVKSGKQPKIPSAR